MLAGGSDAAIIPSGIGGFIACKALSRRNEEPERASRPWDKGRDGFVMGEGAGARPPMDGLLGRGAIGLGSAQCAVALAGLLSGPEDPDFM
jgi:3-oxoacyl-[acyl-carrier-protein] synthase II